MVNFYVLLILVSSLTMTDTIAAGTVQARVKGLQIPQKIATKIDRAK